MQYTPGACLSEMRYASQALVRFCVMRLWQHWSRTNMGLALGMVGGVWEQGGGVGGGMSGYEEVAAETERERETEIEIMQPKMLVALHMYV